MNSSSTSQQLLTAHAMLLLIFSVLFTLGTCQVTVKVTNGELTGTTTNDMNGKPFHSFLSIPFAKPPVGKLRFKDPEPSDDWSGVRDATAKPPLCFQKVITGQFTGVDDCLYLNVYTKNTKPLIKKPVIVYIHGGAFIEGTSSDWGPENLIAEDVVYVTINYRLGVMGFLNFEDPILEVPGNAGMKDQVLALKWVQKEIGKFGGNPSKVTILGESAGGCSVHLHVLSPMSQGLFHQAAALSGTAIAAFVHGNKNSGVDFAKKLGYEGDDPKGMLEFMQNANQSQLEYTMQSSTLLMPVSTPNVFGPTVETKHDKPSFLPDTPRNLLKAGRFEKVPMIMGSTSREGMLLDLFDHLNYNKSIERPIDFYIPYTINDKATATQLENIKHDITEFYFTDNKTKTDQVINLASDAFFINSLHESLYRHVQLKQRVYFYDFGSDTNVNYYKRFHPVTAGYPGACHGDDLGYYFKTPYSPPVEKGSIEDKSIRLSVKLITNFAKYGNPTPVIALGDKLPVFWHRMDLTHWNNVNIRNATLTNSYKKFIDSYKFWCNLYKKYESPEEHFCQF